MAPIPITIVTGFLGSGKTTLILSLVPQLRAANPDYRLALLKNEFGDLAVDSQLAASSAVAGVRELLNGCICCNLVGQLGDALQELTAGAAAGAATDGTGGTTPTPPPPPPPPSRIVIETSGSAFPATLALEVNRLARATAGRYALDGVVSVVDVENWQGYEDTSYTAKLQARYTDLVVFNKWEACGERRFDDCLDRLGDLHADVAWVKSRRGWVDAGLVFGVDGGLLAKALQNGTSINGDDEHGHDAEHGSHGEHDHEHKDDHQSEVEVLSVTLQGASSSSSVDVDKLLALLGAAPKDEVYRIKAVLSVAAPSLPQLKNSDDSIDVAAPIAPIANGTASTKAAAPAPAGASRYILNWAFGRWTFTPVAPGVDEHASSDRRALRMTMILARYESTKWTKKLQAGNFVALAEGEGEGDDGALTVTKIA